MKGYVCVAVVLMGLLFQFSLQQSELTDLNLDPCLNNSVAIQLANNLEGYINPNKINNFAIREPTSAADITNLMRLLYQTVVTSSSPYTINTGIGWPSNSSFAVQSCSSYTYTSPCVFITPDDFYGYIVSYPYFQDWELRLFRVGDRFGNFYFNISNVAGVPGLLYKVAGRPWWVYNNTWSGAYEFYVGGTQSRTYVSQPSPATGVRIYVDRLPNEPCSSCLARSPCVAVADYVSNDAPFQNWIGLTNLSSIQSVFKLMFLRYMIPWQTGSSINSVGIGFANNDFYLVTDCAASTINTTIPECHTGFGYYAEVRNTAYFNDDNLHAFNFTSQNGDTSDNSRDEQKYYPTTERPWYIRGQGWSDPFPFANSGANSSMVARSYSRWFYGGVVIANLNPNNVCPGEQRILSSSASTHTSFVISVLKYIF